MTTPIVESIADNVYDTVNLVTVANGFNQTLVAYRPKRTDFGDVVPIDGVVLVKQSDPEAVDGPLMLQSWIQPFALMAIVLDSDTASTSIDTRLNQVRSDLEKKFQEDLTRGGYAYNTETLPSLFFSDGEGLTGVSVNIAVHYRTLIADPYTKG